MKKEMGNQIKWIKPVFGFVSACFLFLMIYFFSSNQFTNPVKFVNVYEADVNTQKPSIRQEKQENEQIRSKSPIAQEAPVEKQIGPSSPITEQTPDQNFLGKESNEIDHAEKLSCNFEWNSDKCEMEGDIRVHGKSSTVSFVISGQNNNIDGIKTWKLKPFARKFHKDVMKNVRDVEINTLINKENTPKCDVYHDIPAIIFSLTGFSNHIYHGYADVLVPLFITSFQFKGEVQFLVSSMNHWWMDRHKLFVNNLTNYQIIDYDNEDKIHCYSRVIVGLYRHNDLTIDPSRSPNNCTSVDLANYIKKAYSLEGRVTRYEKNSKTKPKLFILARKKTRKFTNLDKIVQMAEELGFQATAGDALPDLNECARYINSFDVMMGVHGAGLTNFIFLPTHAVHIQIVPFGHLEGMAKYDYGTPAMDMKLNYLQYSIDINESTLTDIYPRDDPVFTDPDSIHKKGWGAMAEVYMGQQDVNLNITRFKPVLVQALEILSSV